MQHIHILKNIYDSINYALLNVYLKLYLIGGMQKLQLPRDVLIVGHKYAQVYRVNAIVQQASVIGLQAVFVVYN